MKHRVTFQGTFQIPMEVKFEVEFDTETGEAEVVGRGEVVSHREFLSRREIQEQYGVSGLDDQAFVKLLDEGTIPMPKKDDKVMLSGKELILSLRDDYLEALEEEGEELDGQMIVDALVADEDHQANMRRRKRKRRG